MGKKVYLQTLPLKKDPKTRKNVDDIKEFDVNWGTITFYSNRRPHLEERWSELVFALYLFFFLFIHLFIMLVCLFLQFSFLCVKKTIA